MAKSFPEKLFELKGKTIEAVTATPLFKGANMDWGAKQIELYFSDGTEAKLRVNFNRGEIQIVD